MYSSCWHLTDIGIGGIGTVAFGPGGGGGNHVPASNCKTQLLGGGDVPFLSPGGGKTVSLVVGLGGMVVPVLASPFSGV